MSEEWVGCGECADNFDCYNGRTRCLRRPVDSQDILDLAEFVLRGVEGRVAAKGHGNINGEQFVELDVRVGTKLFNIRVSEL